LLLTQQAGGWWVVVRPLGGAIGRWAVGGVWCIPAAGLSGLDSSASASMSWAINLSQNRGQAQSAPQNGENCTARI